MLNTSINRRTRRRGGERRDEEEGEQKKKKTLFGLFVTVSAFRLTCAFLLQHDPSSTIRFCFYFKSRLKTRAITFRNCPFSCSIYGNPVKVQFSDHFLIYIHSITHKYFQTNFFHFPFLAQFSQRFIVCEFNLSNWLCIVGMHAIQMPLFGQICC